MASKFLVPVRDQVFLETVSYRERLGGDHLVWTVIEVVEGLDLSEVYARYGGEPEVGGRPAFDPAMMVALLVFGYCEGKRSSRALEEACRRDWAYRAICGELTPDHATIARFRVAMDDVLAGLFTQVLAVCAELGMVEVGLVAIDGTRMEAAASLEANRGGDQLARLAAEAEAMLAEAAAADRDDGGGRRRLGDVADRGERIRRAQQVVAEAMERKAAEEKKRGKPKHPVGNVTDPDSRMQKTASGFIQGYNAQVIVGADQVVVAAEVRSDPTDVELLGPMLETAATNLVAAGVAGEMGVGVADAGYWSRDNAALEVGVELLIATGNRRRAGEATLRPEVVAQRDRVIAQVDEGTLDLADAATELGLSVTYTYRLLKRWRIQATTASEATLARLAMEAKLTQPEYRELYRQRSWMIEGSFAHTKHHRRIRRFQRRGLAAVDAEWKLINLAGNIAKIHRRRHRPGPNGPQSPGPSATSGPLNPNSAPISADDGLNIAQVHIHPTRRRHRCLHTKTR